MGVNLTPIMIRHPTSLEALRGRTIAVDGNLELYQFLSIMRTRDGQPLMDSRGRVTSHLNGLLTRTARLIADYDIRPVFVFDGPPPDLKRAEIARRREAREKARAQYEAALASGDVGAAWSKAVMTSRLTREMVEEAKSLLTLLGIPWVLAPTEGEAQAAFLASRGDVWAAGSKDYDALLFGAPRLVRFLAVRSTEFLPSRGRSRDVPPETIDLAENLGALGVTRKQLIDVAILVGTDFFSGLEGFGPKTAIKRVREWGGIDRAPAEVRARLPEDVEAIRAFFASPPVDPSPLPRPGTVRQADAIRFLCEERGFAEARVRAALERLATAGPAGTTLEDFL